MTRKVAAIGTASQDQTGDVEHAEKMVVTPGMAEGWLRRNENNRQVSWAAVAKIAEDIKTGYWATNGETIIIDKKGNIVDGQHRLLAVEQAEKPITTWVVLGVEPGSRDTIDGGRARTHSDRFKMHGESQAKQLAAALMTINIVAYGRRQRSFSQIDKQLKTEYMAAKNAIMPVTTTHTLARSAAVVGGLFYGYAANPAKVTELAEKLVSGANLSSTDPALLLRNYLAFALKRGKQGHILREIVFLKTLRAIQACLLGEKITKLGSSRAALVFFKNFHPKETEALDAPIVEVKNEAAA